MVEHIAGRSRNHDKLDTLEEHAHSISCVYPTLAAGTTVTGAAGAWTLGAFVEIIPANTITKDFDIHWIDVEGASIEDVYELVLYNTTTEIGRVRFNAAKTVAGGVILSPVYFQSQVQAKNSQIQAKLASSSGGGDTVTFSVFYHTY